MSAQPLKAFSAIAIAAVLIGCNAQSVTGAMPQGAANERARVRPLNGVTGDLIYTSYGKIFTYPKGRYIAKLANGYDTGAGLCADGDGNVFFPVAVTENSSAIYEFTHGGTTPIASLSDQGLALGCAIDPATGNLAVTNAFPNAVAVFQNAQGTPMYYAAPYSMYGFCTYDKNSNLFVDFDFEARSFLGELPNGSSNFTKIATKIKIPVSLEWLNGRLLVSTPAQGATEIYPVKVIGHKGVIVGGTVLNTRQGWISYHQYWVQGSIAIGPDAGKAGLAFWLYPAGGNPRNQVSGRTNGAPGIALSVAPTR